MSFELDERHNHDGINSSFIRFKNLSNVSDIRVTFNPNELSSGSAQIQDFTVSAARLGDFILASAPYNLQGIMVNSYVKSSGTASIRLYNPSPSGSAAIDLASGTWVLRLIKL